MPSPRSRELHPACSCTTAATSWRLAVATAFVWATSTLSVAQPELAPNLPSTLLDRTPGVASNGDRANRLPAPDADDAADPSSPPAATGQPRTALPEPAPAATAPPPVPTLVDTAAPIDAWPNLRVWPADEHITDPDTLLERIHRFETPASPTQNLGRLGRPVWLHAAWQVDAASDGRWMLYLRHAPLDDARVYVYEDGRRTAQYRLGAAQAMADRPLPTRAHAAPIELRPGTRADVFVRLSSRGSYVVPFTLEKPSTLMAAEGRAQVLHGLALGLALAVFGYSLARAVLSRSLFFGSYAAFLAGGIGLIACESGLGQQYLWTAALGGLAGKADAAFALLLAASASTFLRHALATRRTSPLFDGVLQALTIIAGTGLLVTPIATVTHADLQQLIGIITPPTLAVGLLSAWFAHRQRGAGATATLVGWLWLMVGTASAAGVARGALPANSWTLGAFEFCFVLQLVALAPVLSMHAHRIRRDADAAAAASARAATNVQVVAKDELTGLIGRRELTAALAEALQRRAPSTLTAVYLLTFDQLEQADDSDRHRTRSALLVQIARRIESMIRADDIVARLGGSDFVVVAHRLGHDADAHALGQKLTAGLRKPIRLSSGAYKVNVRIGYAVAPEHGDDASQLLRRADLAMFDSRQLPRGNLMRYDPNAWPIEEEAGRSRSPAGSDTAPAQLDDESAAAAASLGDNGAFAGPVAPPAAAPSDTAVRRRPEAARTDPAPVDAASTDTIGT